jgi:hypothetical protein
MLKKYISNIMGGKSERVVFVKEVLFDIDLPFSFFFLQCWRFKLWASQMIHKRHTPSHISIPLKFSL